jgi:hypothetical protein
MDWRSSYSGDGAHRRNRKRRFHIHPTARGLGRYVCETASPLPTEEVVAEPETDARKEKERAHATARKGLFVSACIMMVLIACVRFGWFFRIYTWLVDVWMTLVTGTKTS